MTNYKRVMASLPAEKDFTLAMVTDSSVATNVDIDTDIQVGEAWLIYGAEFVFELVARTLPKGQDIDLSYAMALQIQRNDDNTALLNHNDEELMFEVNLEHMYYFSTNGAASLLFRMPIRFGKRTITFSPKLRAVFQTSVDVPVLSDSGTQIAGKIFYDRIRAPDIGASKIGHLSRL
jgi:hypothetical protein